MAYRNKTFVSFASEDIHYYRLMTAWKENENIDFDFYDAHDLNTALDTSAPDTIRRRIRERISNTKQVVLLVGDETRKKASDSNKFLYYECGVFLGLDLPIVLANVNGSRVVQESRIPQVLLRAYTISVSFQPKIIQYGLDNFPSAFAENLKAATPKVGPYQYKSSVYDQLGL